MGIFEELEINPVINAAGTYTVMGGSKMSEATLKNIREISSGFVNMHKLIANAQDRIASLTQNESACICNGAASGLYLAALAAISKKLSKPSKYLTRHEIQNSEILSLSAHHIPYDFALKQLGVKQRFVGFPNIEGSTEIADIEYNIRENTVAIFFFLSSPYGINTPGALPLDDMIQIANKYNLPLVVDAAAQLPPVENLWNFTKAGASATIFSGGKDLRGPQSSGIILGKKDFVSIIQESNFPNYGFGRMLKLGREEIVGIYSAIKQYLEMDHNKRDEFAEACVTKVLNSFKDSELYNMERTYPNEAGQSMALVEISLKNDIALSEIERIMYDGSPSVFIKSIGKYFHINPMTLEENEVDLVIEKLKIAEQKLLQ